MIGKLKGKIVFSSDSYVICDVSGVGYKVLGVYEEEGAEVDLWIHTHVREDQIVLYGFSDLDSLKMFESLISVSKVGPKSALGILEIAQIDQIKEAVAVEDESILTKVSGIGGKTAKRIVLELKGKLDEDLGGGGVTSSKFRGDMEVIEALVAMGYSREQAQEALKLGKETDTKKKISECLKILGKERYV